MRVFISQPMFGRTDEEILQIRDSIFKEFKNQRKGRHIELIESFIKDNPPEDSGRLWYLGDSIMLMDKADLVIFAPGWEKANGCIIERKVCDLYNIPYIESKIFPEGNF